MKVIQILCESFNRYDLELAMPSIMQAGFTVMPMDGFPVDASAKALYAAQTETPYEDRCESKVFSGSKEFLANRIKTRIFSTPWPSWLNSEALDPLTKFSNELTYHEGNPQEPQSKLFSNFVWFVRHLLYCSDYQHVIYLSTLGHSDWGRCGDENKGIPGYLKVTFNQFWMSLVFELFPWILLDQTVVLIHQDHGTARAGREFNSAMFDGFLLIKAPTPIIDRDPVYWGNMRATVVKACGIPAASEWGALC